MSETGPHVVTAGSPAEWSRMLAADGAVAFGYRATSPWLPLGIGTVIVLGCLDWFRSAWPPSDWRAGWVLTPLLLIVGLLFLQYAAHRVQASDAPALVTAEGLSGQKLELVPWDEIRDARWVYTKVNRGIYVVVSPEVYARQAPAATPWDRLGRLVNSRSWNPDERLLIWLERPTARQPDILAFVQGEITRRSSQAAVRARFPGS